MRKLDLQEIRTIELEILKAFDKICRKHGLRYSMAGGTLLGAVRHKGFIPWDDDIDVMMPRPDYMRFLEISKEDFPYGVLSPYDEIQDKKNPSVVTYCKIVDRKTMMIERPKTHGIKGHVYIDVFPIDGLPDSIEDTEDIYRRAKRKIFICALQRYSPYRMRKDKSIFSKIAWHMVYFAFRCIPYSMPFKRLDNFAQSYAFDAAEYVGDIVAGYGRKERVSRHVYDEIIELPFEGARFCAVSGYDEYLRALYGNYMELPPKEQQVRAHDNEAYYIG